MDRLIFILNNTTMKTAIFLFSLSFPMALLVGPTPPGFLEVWYATLSIFTFIGGAFALHEWLSRND